MTWSFDDNLPIYLQIIRILKYELARGKYQPGEKLPAVRELAMTAGVNPNTMQKALSELERSGLVYSHRTSGRFITDDKALLKKIKTDLAHEYMCSFLEQMRHLGVDDKETLEMIQEALKGGTL